MSGEHNHNHSFTSSDQINRAFYIGIFLNISFVVIELIGGVVYKSLALISDASHNLSDVAGLVLSFISFKLLNKKANNNYTYGYRRSTILAALANAIILFFAIGGIIHEAIQRITDPHPLQGGVVAVIAFIGILINGFTAYLFMKGKDTDLNVKGAYLHMLADALISVGVVMSGIIIIYTQWYWLDSVISLVIAVVIFFGTWGLFKQSLKLSLDGVPDKICMESIINEVKTHPLVKDFHHVHVWALSTTENALTGHIDLDQNLKPSDIEKVKSDIKHKLENFNIIHSTLEIDFNEDCSKGCGTCDN